MNAHKLVIVPERGKHRATCVCGWKAICLDSTTRSAMQAFSAHCYAAGLRTKENIRLAELKADLEQRTAAA